MEQFLMTAFLQLLGANPRPAAAIYASLNSDNVKKEAFRAVAKAVLTPEEQDFLEAIFWMQGTCSKDRSKIAHWGWGYSPQLPDAILLVDPEDAAQNHITNVEKMSAFRTKMLGALLGEKEVKPEMPNLSVEGIYVFVEKDFLQAIEHIQKLTEYVVGFTLIVQKNPLNKDGRLLARLSAEPEVRAFLDRLSARRKKSQEAQQQ
jgi:hypothetical protein